VIAAIVGWTPKTHIYTVDFSKNNFCLYTYVHIYKHTCIRSCLPAKGVCLPLAFKLFAAVPIGSIHACDFLAKALLSILTLLGKRMNLEKRNKNRELRICRFPVRSAPLWFPLYDRHYTVSACLHKIAIELLNFQPHLSSDLNMYAGISFQMSPPLWQSSYNKPNQSFAPFCQENSRVVNSTLRMM
jgi:hypothetical protein